MEKLVQLSLAGQAGRIFEHEIRLKKDEILEYGFSVEPTDSKVEFNIHTHRGEEVEYIVKSYELKKSASFRCSSEGTYYLMWENEGDKAATLRFWMRTGNKK